MEKPQSAVFEALCQAHEELHDNLGKLESVVRPASRGGLAELKERLDTVSKQITDHFRFEEQNGYMDAVSKREPWLDRTIQQLREEHRQLEQSLGALIGDARTVTSMDNAFREKIRGWIESVRHHESRENELLQDAFNRDIAAED